MKQDSTHSADREGKVSVVIAGYLDALDRGAAPDRQDLLRQHPDIASQLEAFFADQDRIVPLAQSMPDAAGVSPVAATEAPWAPVRSPALREERRPFGDYEIEAELGRGGMGVVYRAWQISLRRPVALKLILAGDLASPLELKRFRREAELVAQLEHPNIIPLYEMGVQEGQAYLSMKLVEGESLAQALAGGRWPVGGKEAQRQSAELLRDLARAVHHAHERGILHRDLKPANVVMDREGKPYITDFGLGRRLAGGTHLTRTGAIVGTLHYMAPEQATDGKNVTTATDVYSLGTILYELLTGRKPFQGDSPLEVLRQVREQEPLPPRTHDPRIDRDLESICLQCLEKEPARRYSSAEALAEDLERWLCGEPITSRPMGRMRRLVRRMRRQPAVTALLSVAVVLFLLSGSTILWDVAARLRLKTLVAEEQRRRAYLEFVRDAARALDTEKEGGQIMPLGDAQRKKARVLLNSCRSELRALEWYCLNGLCNGLRDGKAPAEKPWQPYEFKLANKETFIALSPDGKSKAIPTEKELIIRDLPSETVRLSLPPPDFGQWCFKSHLTRILNRVDGRTPRERYVLEQVRLFGSVAFSPDGQSLYVAAKDGVLVLDATTGGELRRLTHAPVPEFISPDGKRYYSQGGIFNAFTGRKLMACPSSVFIGFSQDSRRFVLCYLTGEVLIHASANCELLITLPGVKVHYGWSGPFTMPGPLLAGGGEGLIGPKAEDYYNLRQSVWFEDGKSLSWRHGEGVKICNLTPPRR